MRGRERRGRRDVGSPRRLGLWDGTPETLAAWIDADALIMEAAQSFEAVAGRDVSLAVMGRKYARGQADARAMPNTGVLVARNTPWTRGFLRAVYEGYPEAWADANFEQAAIHLYAQRRAVDFARRERRARLCLPAANAAAASTAPAAPAPAPTKTDAAIEKEEAAAERRAKKEEAAAKKTKERQEAKGKAKFFKEHGGEDGGAEQTASSSDFGMAASDLGASD